MSVAYHAFFNIDSKTWHSLPASTGAPHEKVHKKAIIELQVQVSLQKELEKEDSSLTDEKAIVTELDVSLINAYSFPHYDAKDRKARRKGVQRITLETLRLRHRILMAI